MAVKISITDSDPAFDTALEEALSLERFSRYLDWADGDRNRAITLYSLNTALSETLYTPLQMVEVALRNRIHAVMTDAHGDRWYNQDELILLNGQRTQIATAKNDLVRASKPIEPGRLVAALTFSFWTSMLSRDYEQLWRRDLHRIAGQNLPRKRLSTPLGKMRALRNRIAHHEPIVSWSLPTHFDMMIEVIEWLSPPAASWCRHHCRFAEVWPTEGIELRRP